MQAGPIGGTRPLEAAPAKHAKAVRETAVHHDVGESVSVEIGDNGPPTETLLGITRRLAHIALRGSELAVPPCANVA